MRVLIVKMSSMGDVIHTLPAITDAKRAIPGIKFDWLVEEAFAEIPSWHIAVDKVIAVKMRAWRNALWYAIKGGEIKRFFSSLRSDYYDLVIDAQGLLKSGMLARLARTSTRVGWDWSVVREPLASLFYNKKINISPNEHAIYRTRKLFAAALGYKVVDDQINYGVNWQALQLNARATIEKTSDKKTTQASEQANEQANERAVTQSLSKEAKPYLFFLHGTTWQTKHWPDDYWRSLAEKAGETGYEVRMTWATGQQKQRVQKLSEQVAAIKMLPHLSLTAAAVELLGASGVVAVDTGFAHLTAAMQIPSVSLYGPTDSKRIGTIGEKQIHMQAKLPCAPCAKRECKFQVKERKVGEENLFPLCTVELKPELIWEKLRAIIP